MVQKRQYNFDAEMVLAEAATALTATDIPQSGGVDIILDVGAARMEAVAILDISDLADIANNNEIFTFTIQGSNSATFASGIQNLAMMDVGATEVRKGGAIDALAGRYEIPFINEQAGVTYRYLRLHVTIAGTITTGITFGCWVTTFKQ